MEALYPDGASGHGAFVLSCLGRQLNVGFLVEFQASIFYAPLLIICLVIGGLGMFMSSMHLGKPRRFYRAFNNLRHSPMSLKILGMAGFMSTLGLHTLFSLPANEVVQDLYRTLRGIELSGLIAENSANSVAAGLGFSCVVFLVFGLYYMCRSYRIVARPFWNHYQVGTAFVGNAISLGALLGGSVIIAAALLNGGGDVNNGDDVNNRDYGTALAMIGALLAAGIALEAFGLIIHHRDMSAAEHEGAASLLYSTHHLWQDLSSAQQSDGTEPACWRPA